MKRAATFGPVTVALNTDEFIKEFKGSAPIMTYAERRTTLAACRYVDCVIMNFEGADSKPGILREMPDIVVVGMDWLRRDYMAQMQFDADWLEEHGIALAYVPYTQGISTTELKRRFRETM